MNKPVAILISDIHFTVPTLELATKSLEMALRKAEELNVPLVIAGDTLDAKAVIRAEVANRLIEVFNRTSLMDHDVFLMVGNHDLLNEKSEENSLHFLYPYCCVIETPTYIDRIGSHLIPYISDPEDLTHILQGIPKGSRLIMHQGVQSAHMGHYVVDKTSLPKEAFADFRVISGHYHRAQDIKCGRPRKGAVGLFSYIGSPYTQSFGEAEDGPKGFRILMDDDTLESVPTNLRKHVVINTTCYDLLQIKNQHKFSNEDLVWLKITDLKSNLDRIDKKEVGEKILGLDNFKLDLIPLETPELVEQKNPLSEAELFDTLIDNTSDNTQHKEYLKGLWRILVS